MNNKSKWVYSTNPELFQSARYDSKEDAISDAKSDYGDDYNVIYVGRTNEVHPYIDAELAIEQATESIYDVVGEVSEDYLMYLPKEELEDLQKELNTVFDRWLTKYNNHPTFYQVEEIEPIKL